MIKLLARIPYFRRQIIRYALEDYSKPKGFESLEFCFKDEQGRSYYQFAADFDVFIMRKGYWEERLIEMDAGLSSKELNAIFEACMQALNEKKPDYALVAHLIYEMKNRHEWLVHHEIMYDLLAACYIREDEDPRVIDGEVHRDKVRYFMNTPSLSFFFENRTFNELLPFLKNTEDSLQTLLKRSEMESMALMEQIHRITSGAASSSTARTAKRE